MCAYRKGRLANEKAMLYYCWTCARRLRTLGLACCMLHMMFVASCMVVRVLRGVICVFMAARCMAAHCLLRTWHAAVNWNARAEYGRLDRLGAREAVVVRVLPNVRKLH